MQFFLDTANLSDIRRWQAFSLVDGATTNPALLAREGNDPLEHLRQVAEIVQGPVSAQVTCDGPQEMIAQGRALAEVAPNIVVKIPANEAGFTAARTLTESGIRCNVTLTFQAAQAIPFARIPAAYVSLIVGRVEDFGLPSHEEIARTRELFDRLETPTQLLVASIRNPGHLCSAINGGADVVTVPPSTWSLVHQNPLSHQGLEDFSRAWTTLAPAKRESYERVGA